MERRWRVSKLHKAMHYSGNSSVSLGAEVSTLMNKGCEFKPQTVMLLSSHTATKTQELKARWKVGS